jgi:hypothetical protein
VNGIEHGEICWSVPPKGLADDIDLENLKAAQKCDGIDPTKSYYLYGHELIVMPRMRGLYDEDVAQQRYG